MNPQTKAKLVQKLNDHGLTVLQTCDHTAMLLQLARLAQFERQMLTMAQVDRPLAAYVKQARSLLDPAALDDPCRVLEAIDIPEILTAVNRMLHEQYSADALLVPSRISAAVTAFIAIICRR